jgi:hypothetical protein
MLRQAVTNLTAAALPLGELVDHLLELVEQGVDPDTGEVRLELGGAIDQLNLSLQRKVEAYGHVCERLRAEAEAYHELEQAYRGKAQARELEQRRLRERLQAELEKLGTDKLKTPTVTVYLQRSPQTVELLALDDREIPDEYCVIERRPSLSAIAAALKGGAQLAFAQLAPVKRHLRFR